MASNISLNTIDSAIHSIAAVQSGTWDIGTVTSITNAVTIQDGGNVISIDDAGGSITVDGSVTVSATDLDIRDLTHASDSVKVGDGTDFLAVNNDGSINAVVTGTITAAPDAYDSWQHERTVVGTSAVQITATPLANRLSMIFQNNSNNDIAIGTANTVTVGGANSGTLVYKRSSVAIDFGAGVTIYAIASAANSELIVTELAS